MFKIKNNSLLLILLYLMLFIGVISNIVGGAIGYGLVLFLILVMFLNIRNVRYSSAALLYSFISFVCLLISYLYNLYQYNFNNLYFFQFFGSQVLFFYLLPFFVDVERFILKDINKFIIGALVLICLFIMIDSYLISLGMVNKQLSFNSNLAENYLHQPLGLFRQFSVNATYAIVFYLLYLHFKNTSTNVVLLFFLVTFSIILQNSGTGFILYVMMLLTIFYHFFFFRYFVSFILISIFVFLVMNNMIEKISLDYFIFSYEYFYSIVDINYFENVHSMFDFLFGIDGNYKLPIDFGPIFMIGKVGFLYFLLYSIAIFYLIFKAPDRFLKMALLCLVIGNIHYPTLFYPIMNIMLPLLAIYILNYNKRKKLGKINFNS